MTTRQLWLALMNPPRRHALFQWGMRQPRLQPRRWWTWSVVGVCVLALLILVITAPTLAFTALVAFAVVTPALMLVGNGVVLGAWWAIRTNEALQRLQHQHGELLDATLAGGRDGAWLVTQATLHQGRTLMSAYRVVRGMCLSLLLAVGFACTLILLNALFSPTTSFDRLMTSINAIAPFGAIMAVLWLDHLQSILTGCLVGMVSARRNPLPTMGWTTPLVAFVTVQMSVYIVLLLLYAVLQVLFEVWLGQTLYLTPFSWSMVLVFICLREAVLWGLWRWVKTLYETR